MPRRVQPTTPAAAGPHGHQPVAPRGTPGAAATAACPRCGAHGRWGLRGDAPNVWLEELGAGCACLLGDDEWLDLGGAARAFLD